MDRGGSWELISGTAMKIEGMPQAVLAFADTDGFGAPTDFTVALVDGSTLSRSEKLGMISSANLELMMLRVC